MALGAAYRFHLRTAVRVSWRLAALQAAALAALPILLPDPSAFLAAASQGVGAEEPLTRGVLALWCLAAAHAAAPRGASVLRGWMLHLPLGTARRRALVFALASAAVLPPVVWMALWVHALLTGAHPGLTALASVAPMTIAAAALAVPLTVQARLLVGLGFLAAVISGTAGLAAATVCLVLADRSPQHVQQSKPAAVTGRDTARAFPFRVALRAVLSGMIHPLFLAVFTLVATVFVLRNNPELSTASQASVVRFGAGFGVLTIILGLCGALREHRPAWPWSRSWPWSSANRVRQDLGLVLLASAPVVVAAAVLSPRALLPVAALTLLLALRAIAAVHRNSDDLTALGRGVTLESMLWITLTGLFPYAAVVFVFLLPVAYRRAVTRERTHKVGALGERHYLASGDSLA